MNFSLFLLEFVKKHGSVSFPGFGTFYLQNINAVLDEQVKNILPPATEIAFKSEASAGENEFSSFFATQKSISEVEADQEIKKQVNYWKATLYKDKKVQVENLGTFFLDESKIIFSGIRIDNLSPDFYGLEEINLSEIKNSSTKTGNSYRLSETIYWLVPLILGILALTYFGVTQPEMIFGKKSVLTTEPKKQVIAVKKDTLNIDSLNAVKFVQDSIKNDSLQKATSVIKPPVKKWSSKNYSKTKWKKPKKRRNR